ncbi:hypothetical protein ACQK5W_04065 [Pantoea sp. FN060301]
MSSQSATESYRRQQEEAERQRKEEAAERMKDFDFIRWMVEAIGPGVKK